MGDVVRRQEYWCVVDLRDSGAFEPLGPEPPRKVPRDSSVEEFADALLADGLAELDDLRGELRVRVFDTPTPGTDTKPVVERTGDLRKR